MSDKKIINPNPPRFSFIFGRPFAPFYGWLMSVRASLYKKGRLKSHKLGVPVVSVGNLTMGGTGKTPMVMYLAKLFAADRKVAIVSRGYRSGAKDDINLVANEHELLLEVEQAGDEPYLMAEMLPGVVVATGKDRALVGDYCEHVLGCDLILLDDGFQHLKLQRDLDIVLFKVDSFLGNNRVFPGGDMREPLAALHRADCFVLTCVNDEKLAKAEAIKLALQGRFPDIPVFFGDYVPVCLEDKLGAQIAIDNCSGMTIGAFCGLAQPFYFRETLARAGFEVQWFKSFGDHHVYTQGQVDSIVAKAQKMKVEALVVTEKDFVKLADCSCDLPIYKLQMHVRMESAFDTFVLHAVGD